MTPKQRYDERKRLRAERLLREEQRAEDHYQREQDLEARMVKLMTNFERIADVMELWADLQGENDMVSAAREVVSFDWSDNDADAVAAIDRLRKAVA